MNQREQLLKTLNDDLQGFEIPKLYDEAKKAEIMRARKGQADIDKGREEIRKNREAYDNAIAARGKLQDKIAALTKENEARADKERQESPLNQAVQYGKSLGIPAAGYAAGHVAGAKFGKAFDVPASERAGGVNRLAEQLRRVDKTAPASKAQADAIVRTYDRTNRGRGLSQFLGPAALGASSVATQVGADYVDDPTLKEGLNLAANAERYGAVGMASQQIIDTLRGNAEARRGIDPTDVATIESARRQVNAGGKFDRLQGALREADPAPAAPAAPAAKPAPKPGTVAAMRQQAKDMQLKGYSKLDKDGLSKALAKAIREQGAKRGPATPAASAVGKVVKGAKKAPKMLFPAAVGFGVYDALRNPAEAGGAMAGLGRLGSALANVPGIGTAARAVGRAVPPLAAGMTAYDIGNMAIEENAKPDQLLNGPQDGGAMPQTPGNPGFMDQQSQLARQAHGQAPADPSMQVSDADFAPIVAAAEQDPQLAEELRQLIMQRLEEAQAAQQQQIPYAMASQEVAARGDPMADALRTMAMR